VTAIPDLPDAAAPSIQISSEDGAPTKVISAGRKGFRVQCRSLWAHRELVYFLIWRDIKVRYKQTALGASWAILQPFLLMVVFTVFLGRLSGIAPKGVAYPVFTFAALVPWTLFAQALTYSADSLVRNAQLVGKVSFPRLVLPIAAAASFLFDFVIAFVILLAMMAYYGIYPNRAAAWLPLFILLDLASALGVGIWLAALNVRFRDIRYALPFLIQLWLFASPIAYATTVVPERWRTIYAANPIVDIVQGFRWGLLGGAAPSLAATAIMSAGLLVVAATGVMYFQRAARTFADVI
jgi:lipopolysaccharide transport system permease protein